ncbi:hypothetical protein [Pseudomonas putida]|jgi:hypothetical protein|uniref:hypothetical protein n=1 Tax=Pseudomonas putida TaxID=303 RepID=UPI00111F5E65|nr:hypothetical protein [Pseudomonas putida]MCF1251738.1 hypothetical protein [Pseudomonas putida]
MLTSRIRAAPFGSGPAWQPYQSSRSLIRKSALIASENLRLVWGENNCVGLQTWSEKAIQPLRLPPSGARQKSTVERLALGEKILIQQLNFALSSAPFDLIGYLYEWPHLNIHALLNLITRNHELEK